MQKDDDDESSKMRRLYTALFQVPQKAVMVHNVGLTFEVLKEIFPERVLLARLDDIFTAWKASHDRLPSNHQVSMTYPASLGTQCRILYDYDHNTYRSTVAPIAVNGVPQVEIKLSNDGFIYPSRDSLSLDDKYDSKKTHHKRHGWARLSDETINTHFRSLIDGAKSVMGVTGEIVDDLVLYHEHHERVDFLFRKKNGTARVLITFEPGDPEHFHSDDIWGQC